MKYFHHIIHVIGIIIISTVIYNIISPENEWVSLLYVSVIPVVIGIIYRKIQEYSLIIVSNIVLVILYLLHLGILIDVALGNLNI
jgi:nicotinamide riboside transporter PnuC